MLTPQSSTAQRRAAERVVQMLKIWGFKERSENARAIIRWQPVEKQRGMVDRSFSVRGASSFRNRELVEKTATIFLSGGRGLQSYSDG